MHSLYPVWSLELIFRYASCRRILNRPIYSRPTHTPPPYGIHPMFLKTRISSMHPHVSHPPYPPYPAHIPSIQMSPKHTTSIYTPCTPHTPGPWPLHAPPQWRIQGAIWAMAPSAKKVFFSPYWPYRKNRRKWFNFSFVWAPSGQRKRGPLYEILNTPQSPPDELPCTETHLRDLMNEAYL